MTVNVIPARGRRLERSCSDWVRIEPPACGVQRLRAWFGGAAFARHRHDTYAIGVTDSGIQSFGYRGSRHDSAPGNVVVLHPDEPHDGYAGTPAGFGYRIVYFDPSRVFDAACAIAGRASPLPFVRRPVVDSPRLARAVGAAFACNLEPLAADAVVLRFTALLIELVGDARTSAAPLRIDRMAIERARCLLDTAIDRVVHSSELESASGLSRFELARQFRSALGTSPYRYSLERRLEFARDRLAQRRSTADVALEAGFSDQAHFTRMFRATFGLTPARYRALRNRRATSV